ncbi:hypothetical protein [Saccharothrix australiensis]|uniref:Uncharacterized protein n=1 Tax=Saccharothrix australiensis TaxID=2072 RepID=A0A495VJE2_9PSEU|nr:hypothetical protein [Saccharothrix australiensis]RKT49272.1 hypothetical protein C8E97_6768 [Saccharothrix australiensis]RKT49372.1 hypothetical protein C8E97_6751 [Saccharothrix australiensis]
MIGIYEAHEQGTAPMLVTAAERAVTGDRWAVAVTDGARADPSARQAAQFAARTGAQVGVDSGAETAVAETAQAVAAAGHAPVDLVVVTSGGGPMIDAAWRGGCRAWAVLRQGHVMQLGDATEPERPGVSWSVRGSGGSSVRIGPVEEICAVLLTTASVHGTLGRTVLSRCVDDALSTRRAWAVPSALISLVRMFEAGREHENAGAVIVHTGISPRSRT